MNGCVNLANRAIGKREALESPLHTPAVQTQSAGTTIRVAGESFADLLERPHGYGIDAILAALMADEYQR